MKIHWHMTAAALRRCSSILNLLKRTSTYAAAKTSFCPATAIYEEFNDPVIIPSTRYLRLSSANASRKVISLTNADKSWAGKKFNRYRTFRYARISATLNSSDISMAPPDREHFLYTETSSDSSSNTFLYDSRTIVEKYYWGYVNYCTRLWS